jgi:uncharacterized lipoprotein YddW (UPF0748 family)
VLAKWWADVVKPTHTRLYIGVALYKVGEPSKNEPDWTVNGGVPELKKQLDLNDSLPSISGTILFREDYLNQPQTQDAVSYLKVAGEVNVSGRNALFLPDDIEAYGFGPNISCNCFSSGIPTTC